MTTSYAFFVNEMPREGGVKGFMINQSITDSHLENVKIANFAHQGESPNPEEHFLNVKQ